MARAGVASTWVVLLAMQILSCSASGRSVDVPVARSLLASPISAGSPCSLNDICSGSADEQLDQLCPADPKTHIGVCPPTSAGDQCNPGDMCATSATTSALCPTATDDNGASFCPVLALDATCSALAGQCNETQLCSARLPNADAIYDPTVGVCLTYLPAGSACKANYDVCNTDNTDADPYCSSSSCPLLAPDAMCLTKDQCRSGVSKAVACPVPEGDDGANCPPQAAGAACLLGDPCADPQVCNAIGTSPGTCVAVTLHYGEACAAGKDYCPSTIIDAEGSTNPAAVICPASKICPFVSAGKTCNSNYNEICNNASPAGLPCPGTTTDAFVRCPVLAAGAACYATDSCGPDADGNTQVCNALGTAQGTCVTPKAAGGACTANQDVCSPSDSLCTAATCPLVPAGQDCNVNDTCSSGTTGGVLCVTSGNGQSCPPLATGLACTADDLCVRGASCTGGTCLPNPKAKVASTGAGVYSTATMVPSVNSIATLSSYASVDAFNSTEKTRFINTLEANILAQINAVTNVTITKVTLGSINVNNNVAFTGASSSDALSGQTALATLLASQDGVSSIFGTTFGSVTVSNVTKANSTNPTVNSGSVTTGLSLTMGIAVAVTSLLMSL